MKVHYRVNEDAPSMLCGRSRLYLHLGQSYARVAVTTITAWRELKPDNRCLQCGSAIARFGDIAVAIADLKEPS